jgi:thiol-disulfide isomerase/thioredoxin
MDELLLDPRMIRMPEFAPGTWLNTAQPLAKETLRGQVTLIDFWDYTCINCIRTLPYVTAWYARYADQGLRVIGVHSPEFNFAQHRAQIEAAIERYELGYPILLDNQYENWYRFAVKAWPTKLLIDADGYIRYVRQGEGYYRETERAIQLLLRERDPQLGDPRIALPPLMDPIREEDSSGAVCYRPTPELYAGSERGSLGNRQGYADHPVVYEMPMKHERREPRFYADGIWLAHPESFAFAGQEAGRIMLPYHAVTVNAVLSPSSDPVEVMLNLKPGNNILPMVEIRQDGHSLMPDNAGADIEYDDGGVSYVNVGQPRLYELVRNADFEQHELELIFRANGLSLYSFTFTSCVVPSSRAAGGDAPGGTYRVG